MPHLFLFSLNNDNNVVLTSYEIPSDSNVRTIIFNGNIRLKLSCLIFLRD